MISPSFVRSLLGISRLRLVSIGVILTAAWVSIDISHPTLSAMGDSKKVGIDEDPNTPVSYSSRGVYCDRISRESRKVKYHSPTGDFLPE